MISTGCETGPELQVRSRYLNKEQEQLEIQDVHITKMKIIFHVDLTLYLPTKDDNSRIWLWLKLTRLNFSSKYTGSGTVVITIKHKYINENQGVDITDF